MMIDNTNANNNNINNGSVLGYESIKAYSNLNFYSGL